MGFRGNVSRSTLADANEAHDWRIFADFAQVLIHIARPMYANDPLGFDLDNTVYALDSTTIDLCLSVFPWARFRSRKAAIKLHTLLDLRGPIPTFIEVSEGKLHDVNILDAIVPEPDSFYVMDRAYVDFERLHVLHSGGALGDDDGVADANGPEQPQPVGDGKPLPVAIVGNRRALHVIHHQIQQPVLGGAAVQKPRDIRMVEGGQDLAFVPEPAAQLLAVEGGLDRLDGAHAAAADFAQHFVRPQSSSQERGRRLLGRGRRFQKIRAACSAVHYVHQNLVVHCDLKPSNLLVTAAGTPKLLDFGIAKLLNPEFLAGPRDATRVELRLMTPGCASPEQLRGEPITTSADVYSLGILLYELLTGGRPYQLKNRLLDEVARVVCHQEPERPSAAAGRTGQVEESASQARQSTPERLARSLRGDLDNIVLKAIRKEPQRRYASVEQLSEDLQRRLEGRPVLAHRDTAGYRAAKFIRRNRTGVAAAALLLLALVGGMVATSWQARVARAERARAERRFNDVRKLANSFLFEFHDSIRDLPGSTPARELVVRKALEYLDSLSREAGADISLRSELAQAYSRVGDVQGLPFNPNLGDLRGAQESFTKALRVLEGILAVEPAHQDARRLLAGTYQKLGDIQAFGGDMRAALESGRKSLALFEALAQEAGDLRFRRLHAISLLKMADLLGSPAQSSAGDRAAALDHYRRSQGILDQLRGSYPSDSEGRRLSSVILERIGTVLEADGRLEEAERSFRQALAITESRAADSPGGAGVRRDLAAGYARMGKILALRGQSRQAAESYRKSLDLLEALAAADPSNENASRSLAEVLGMAGDSLSKGGDRAAARRHYSRAVDILERLAAKDPNNRRVGESLAEMKKKVG